MSGIWKGWRHKSLPKSCKEKLRSISIYFAVIYNRINIDNRLCRFFCCGFLCFSWPAFTKRTLCNLTFLSFFISSTHSFKLNDVLNNITKIKKARYNTCILLLKTLICCYNLADNSLPALKRATFLALILITAPV